MNEVVVVGIDESSGSQRALEWALAEAARRRAPVRMVHAIPPFGTSQSYDMMVLARSDTLQEEAEEAARELLETALAKAGGAASDVEVEFLARFGGAADVLVQASREAGLLVVGSRGRGGFTGLLLGSVSQQVVQHAHCPVVVIPAPR